MVPEGAETIQSTKEEEENREGREQRKGEKEKEFDPIYLKVGTVGFRINYVSVYNRRNESSGLQLRLYWLNFFFLIYKKDLS